MREKWGSKYIGKLLLLVLLLKVLLLKCWFVFKTSYMFYSLYLIAKCTIILGSIHVCIELCVYAQPSAIKELIFGLALSLKFFYQCHIWGKTASPT